MPFRMALGAAGAACLAAVLGGGCGDAPPLPPPPPRLASFKDTFDGKEVVDIVVWKSVKLEQEAFFLTPDDQVEVLRTDQAVDPESGRPLQVMRVRHAKGEGWVEARYIRR